MKNPHRFVSPTAPRDARVKSFGVGFARGFQHGRGAEQLERERLAELQRPVPRDVNPPELMKKVPVRVRRAFCVGGRPQLPGEIVSVESYIARGLVAIGKAEWPKPE